MTSDPRLQLWAYLTDGDELFELIKVDRSPGVMGATTIRYVLENCRTELTRTVTAEGVAEKYELVRAAPQAAVA